MAMTPAKAAMPLGGVATGSKTAFTEATFNQVYGGLCKPGESLEGEQKDYLAAQFKTTPLEITKLENKYKREHPRYNKKSQEYDEGGRRAVMRKPNNTLQAALVDNSVEMDEVTATNVGQLTVAAFNLVNTGVKKANKNCTTVDGLKMVNGNLLKQMGPKRGRKEPFNGKGKRRRANDYPN